MRRHHRWLQLMAALTALVLFTAACGDDDDPDDAVVGVNEDDDDGTTTTTTSTPSTTSATDVIAGVVQAEDQLVTDGDTLEVEEVTITGSDGWVVAHADDGGSPGAVVGTSIPISEGTSTDVPVTLSEPIEAGTYWLMLHYDAGTPELFEFPGPDAPVMEGSDTVMTSIEVTTSGS